MSKGNPQRRSSQAGFMIVLVLTSIATVAVVTVLILSQHKQRTKNNVYINATFIGKEITDRLASYVQNQAVWLHSVYHANNNGILSCLKSPGSSCAAFSTNPGTPFTNYVSTSVTSGAFQLADPSGAIYYDSTVATNGFDKVGNPCSTFDPVNGNDRCPYRAVLYWKPSCGASVPCDDYWVYGYVLYKPRVVSDYQVPYKVGVDTVNGIMDHAFAIEKSSTNSKAYCCTIVCKHNTGDSGVAYATQSIYNSSNCYAGSTEIGTDFCDRALTNTLGDSEWVADNATHLTPTAGSCSQGM